MNKKGFTLIELLAVIIVLAIIALIATPIIFNVIENAKIKSMENSTYGVIDAVRTRYAESLLNSENGNIDAITKGTDGKGVSVLELTVSGEKPTAGTYYIDDSSTATTANRGIKVWGVKFASMNGYTCSNTSDGTQTGTLQTKVTCKK